MLHLLLPARLRPSAIRDESEFSPLLRENFGAARKKLLQSVIFSLIAGLLALAPAIFSMQVFDRVVGRQSSATLYVLMAGIGFVLFIEWFVRKKRDNLLRQASALVDWALSMSVRDAISANSLRNLEASSASRWNLLFRDVAVVRGVVTSASVQAIFDIPLAILSLLVVALVAAPLLPVVLIAMVGLAAFSWWQSAKEDQDKTIENSRSLDAFNADFCRARQYLKAMAQDEHAKVQWTAHYEAWLDDTYKKWKEDEQAREFSRIAIVVTTLSMTAVGALAVLNQWMSIGGIVAANMLALKVISPVSMVASSWSATSVALDAASRLRRIFQDQSNLAEAEVLPESVEGFLTLKNVSFSYAQNTSPILSGVTMRLAPKKMYAVVGPNGAGKSTFLKLLAGLYQPSEGNVFLDNYDLTQFSREQAAGMITSVPQEIYFLDGTIADQLKRAAPSASDAELIKACQLAGVHQAISKLPSGYSTSLQDGGQQISAGMRRKLVLAQMYLRNTAVVLLDEPSSDLDAPSETRLALALKALAKHRTIVVVTHSRKIVEGCDVVVEFPGDGSFKALKPEIALKKYFKGPQGEGRDV